MDKNRVLVLAPHTDDGELGYGATMSKMLEQGKEVYYVAFSTCEESVPEGFAKEILAHEVIRATSQLGLKSENLIIKNYKVRYFPGDRQAILEDMVALNRELKPELVFTPSSFDVHQDHKTIYEEGRRAFKNTSILGYEFMWNNFAFDSRLLSVISDQDIVRKVNAIEEYKSQERRFYAKEKLIRGQANFRGLQISEEFAEAFEVIRWILK